MATAFLSAVFSIMVLKTLLVADNILERHGRGGILRRLSQCWRYIPESSELSTTSNAVAQGGHASRFRLLHTYFFLAHLTASISTGASLVRVSIHNTKFSCLLTLKIFVTMAFLHQGFLVLFLEKKTEVTKMNRSEASRDPCWQLGVKRFARIWGFVIQPASTVLGAIFIAHDPLEDRDSECFDEERYFMEKQKSQQTGWMIWFAVPHAVKVILLLLLLAIFIRPLLATGFAGASVGISYKRIIIRNIVSAALITFLIVARTMAMSILINSDAPMKYELEPYAVTMSSSALIQLVSLCITEMTLAIGFTSCFATIQDETKRRRSSVLDDLGPSMGATTLVDSPFTHQPVWRTIDLRNFNSGSRQINATAANDRPDAGGGAL